jgi:osmotically-inducible protein OsmY
MLRLSLFALSMALIGFTACNKSSQEKANEKSAAVREDAEKAAQDIKENAQDAAAKVKEEAREAASDIKKDASNAAENIRDEAGKANSAVRNTDKGDQASAKVREESRQASKDVREEARQTNGDIKTEARQTARDVREALGIDKGKTDADDKLNNRIRDALKADNATVHEGSDVVLETVNGHVHVRGTVASEDAKKEIASVARKVAGLTHVSDEMKVAERVGAGPRD